MLALAAVRIDPLVHWYELAGIVVAIPVAVTLMWATVKIYRRAANLLRLVYELIFGRPKTPVSEKIPSLIERFEAITAHLRQQDEILDYVKGELDYNGGNSTKDQVRKLGTEVGKLKDGQAQAIGREGTIAGTAVATAEALHTETVDTAADVADLTVKTAKDLAKKAPAKKVAPRKRAALKSKT